MVQLSNASGRVYFDYHFDECGIHSGSNYEEEIVKWAYARPSGKRLMTPRLVPNGKWVMESPSTSFKTVQLVGVKADQVEKLSYTDEHNLRHELSISDHPFGYITVDDQDIDRSSGRVIRRQLEAARQIHLGQLGRGSNVPFPPYVRQPFEPHQKTSIKKAHQRRRGYGWVSLPRLGEALLCRDTNQLVETILGYWSFSGHLEYEAYWPVGTLVDTVWGSDLDILSGNIEVESLTPQRFREEAEDISELWIRRGFAYTILRLWALGVHPDIFATA